MRYLGELGGQRSFEKPEEDQLMSERETSSLIGSDKVDGTAVYGADQQKIGSVQRWVCPK